MKTKKQFNKGFTLVELLVSLVIIASFGTIVMNIVTSTFRGTSKTDIINKVRENGNYAISEITRTIKYAKSFDGALDPSTNIWTCDTAPSPPAPTPIPVQYKAVKATSFDGVTTIFSCETDTINANGRSLMDSGPTGSVTLSTGTCFFTCGKENIADSPTIGIRFTITSKITSGIAEKQAIIPFANSIKFRN
jgi:prepilin-type N-terminal cleavage/methylation domain-containing protein